MNGAAATPAPRAGDPRQVRHRRIQVQGIELFYREAGPPDAPVLLLLHGFPSSSFQFRGLMSALSGRFRLVAPDYPGFGHSAAPLPATAGGDFDYSFERLAQVVAGFCDALELRRFVAYLFDFGGPVGLRLAQAHPQRIAGLIVQNANAYEEGLSGMARELATLTPQTAGAESQVRELLRAETTRWQYLAGAADPERIAPDGWTLDQHFLDLPGRDRIQVDLALDYHRNLALYPQWQAWLRRHRPPALVLWGRNDPIFVEAGARAWLRDLPDAALELYDTGHFALEEAGDAIAARIDRFLSDLYRDGADAPPPRGV